MMAKSKILETLQFLREFGVSMTWHKYFLYRIKGLDTNERNIAVSKDIADFMYKNFSYVLDMDVKQEIESPFNSANSPVWVFWWQGEKEMPQIVQVCYNSIIRNTPANHPVILLDRNNFKQYSNIPTFIVDYVKQGKISLAHFSDILRANLLSIHGGFWLDATIYITQQISEELFHRDFFSPIPYLSSGKKYYDAYWSVFAQGGTKGNMLHVYLFRFLCEFLKNYNMFINYLLQDDIIRMLYEHNDKIRALITDGGIHTNGIFKLQRLFEQPYDDELFNKIITENTYHKLSYKRGNISNKENPTFYDHIISELNKG